MLHLDISLIT